MQGLFNDLMNLNLTMKYLLLNVMVRFSNNDNVD